MRTIAQKTLWVIGSFVLFSLPAFAAGGTCPSGTYSIQGSTGTLTALGVTSCYFVSQSTGSDTNAGTTEASPWAHMPEMPSCTSSCSGATIAAGTGIILRGGEVWAASDLGITWTHSGTASHPNYIGVDPTWYNATNCGASWCRPVFNPAGSAMTSSEYFFLNNGSTAIYTTVDNIEETGWSCAAMESGTMNGTISPDGEFENLYVHGWSYSGGDVTCQVAAFSANISDGASQITGFNVHNSVVDGSDQTPSPVSSPTTTDSPIICALHGYIFANNVCRYVYNINGVFNQISGNWIDHILVGNSGDHCNMTNWQGIAIGNVGNAFNNIYSNMDCSGGLIMWLSGNSASSSAVYNAFGNLFYSVGSGAPQKITTCTHPTQGVSCGVFNVFNNTDSGSGGQLTGNGECSISATSFTGTSGTLTFTTANQSSCGGSGDGVNFTAGISVQLTGFSGGNTGLNGQIVTVLSGGLSATSFEAVVTGSGYSSGSGTVYGPLRGTINVANNHIIGSDTLCENIGMICNDEGNELIQCSGTGSGCADQNVTPTFNQYTDSQSPYADAPVASTNSTVGAGQNACSTLGISCTGILAAALSDTTYATENTSTHTVVMRTVNLRGSTWDIGAYQFSAASLNVDSFNGLIGKGLILQ